MKRTLKFLQDAGTFYLATVEADQPRVRPFGAVCSYNGRLYICTNNTKACFKQMTTNPKVEISAMVQGEWIRLSGTVAIDTSKEAKTAMLEAYPQLKQMYSPTDGIFEVLYFTKACSTFYSFAKKPETEEF